MARLLYPLAFSPGLQQRIAQLTFPGALHNMAQHSRDCPGGIFVLQGLFLSIWTLSRGTYAACHRGEPLGLEPADEAAYTALVRSALVRLPSGSCRNCCAAVVFSLVPCMDGARGARGI
jgi:hypothetical protein